MRRRWRKAKPKKQKIKFIAGERIRAPKIFLIDENGGKVGVVLRDEALKMAREAELDLVLVNPKTEPPVAKLADLGQIKYEMEKKIRKQKMRQKKTETKELRLSVRISAHDFTFRLNQAEKFLENDNKVKIGLVLKGREKQHPDKAYEIINKFANQLREKENLNIEEEQPLTREGGRFNIILMNKK